MLLLPFNISSEEKNETLDINRFFEPSKHIIIPNEMIEKIRAFNGEQGLANEINSSIYRIVKDSLSEYQYFEIMNPMFVNLDTDKEIELVCLFGLEKGYASLGIFDLTKAGWACVFFQDFNHHYDGVNFSIANNPSKEKIITINDLEVRGTGIFKEAIHFFKLIDGDVKHVLRLVSHSHVYGWGLNLNRSSSTKYYISSLNGRDHISVTYDYYYYPSHKLYKNLNIGKSNSLINGQKSLAYKWDSLQLIYQPKFSDEDYSLTSLQLKAIEEFENDTIVYSAFKKDFEDLLLGSDTLRKFFVNNYLEAIGKKEIQKKPEGRN